MYIPPMKRFLSEAIVLILIITATFLWQKSSLSSYTISLLGFLTVSYILTTFSKKITYKPFPIMILIISSILLILSTGGFHSPLFFLIYFLSFTIAFVLLPETVFVFNTILFLFFLPESIQGDTLANLTKLLSLFLLCPIAYFFGKEIRQREKRTKRTKEVAEKIKEDVYDVIKAEGTTMQDSEVQKLADIMRQTKDLEKDTTK